MVLNIQVLRAIAALMVVVYHLGPHYEHAGGAATLLVAAARWGFFGVDIFFIISGFVISHTVLAKSRNLGTAATYWRHRLSRIYLGYWPFALLALFVMPLHATSNLDNISTFRTLTLSSADIGLLALPVAWSLAYELYFYGIFGALYLFSDAIIRRVLLVLSGLLLVRVLFIDMDQQSNGYFWVSAYMLEFLFGVLIYQFRQVLSRKPFMLLSAVLMVSGFALLGDRLADHDSRALYLGLSAAGIVLLAVQLETQHIWTGPSWLVSLGNSSYALYLCHLFVINGFDLWGWRDALSAQPQFVLEAGFLAVVVFTVALAHFWYLRVELPVYRFAIGRKPATQPQPG